jgi:hypothetical protein
MKTVCLMSAFCLLAAGGLADSGTNATGIRLGSGEATVDRYLQYHYTAAILGDVTQLASYDSVYPDAIPAGSALQKRLEQQRQKFSKNYECANSLGLAVCLATDEVTLPIPILERLQKSGQGVIAESTPFVSTLARPQPQGTNALRIDFTSEEFWNVYRAKYREVLRAYPRVAYVMVRTGENYSHPEEGFSGHTVVVHGKYDAAYFRNMQRLIEETRKVVVDECGRQLIWRTWDLGNDGFHANPAVYDRVLEGLTNRNGLIFSIKHTQTDFWPYNDFNPTIGRGGVDQIVEFQAVREYEGKGAFPDYMGPVYAVDMRKARDLGVKNVWIWDFVSQRGGPYLKSERWVRLNIEASSRLAEAPGLSPRALAEEWAAKEYGSAAAGKVTDMLMLSGECVRKIMYIEAYARHHRGWKPSLNLMRDDIIRGEGLKALYEGSKDALPEVLAEKAEGVALAGQMRGLFESARNDIVAARGEQVYEESLGSLIYLESLGKVMEHYVSGMFMYYQWEETHDAAAGTKAGEELRAWQEAWQYYQTEVPKLPGVASLYLSRNTQSADSAKGAMAELCEAALKSLAGNITGTSSEPGPGPVPKS